MAAIKADKAMKSLNKKGFVQEEGSHHWFQFEYNGKIIVRTHTSHNNQDIDDYLISKMSKQCLMDKQFFKDFISCTKSKEDYVALLKGNGKIEAAKQIESPKTS